MKYIFKLPSVGEVFADVVELPDDLTDRQVDNVFIDWLTFHTAASWEVHQDLPEKTLPSLKILQ